MFKKYPFLTTSVIFAVLSLILLMIAAVSVVTNDTSISKSIAGLLKVSTDSFNNSTIGQLSLVFAVPSFIFAFKAIDTEVINKE